MTDKYADLRAALDAAPTPGPWRQYQTLVCAETIAIESGGDEIVLEPTRGILLTDAQYIAAADPETIRALLADYDCLRKAAAQVDALYPNVWDLVEGGLFIMPESVKRFDAAFDALRSALSQEQER